MSSEETENTLKTKLMEILEEEISALKLSEVKNQAENECLNNNHPSERNVDTVKEREAFSSSGDNTAEILLENVDQNTAECEYEDPHSPNEVVAGGNILQQINNQYQKAEYVPNEEAFKPVNEKAAEKLLPPTYYSNQKVDMKDMGPFVIPSDSLAEKILRRIEFCFQDYNIFKNSFLLNHVRRNKKGYLSLRLVASLRKIRALTRDFRVVAYCIKKSKILELNPEGNKIRRIEPLPRIEDTSFGKTVMIFNLPRQIPTRDFLRELFSKFGTVVSVGVFDADSPDGDVYHDRCLHFHRKIASKIYGMVEFEKYDEVVNALRDEEGHLPKENEMKVVPLMPQIYKKEKRYLKFLEPNNRYPRGGYGRFRPRNEPHAIMNEIPPSSGDGLRNGKMNVGGFQYSRGNFRRPYRGRRIFMPPNTKQYSTSQIPNDYSGMKSNQWSESRQLKANNSFNIGHYNPNIYRKKQTNGYIENAVPL